jgi:hypothetical protein
MAVALSGIGEDNYSGSNSLTTAQEILVCVGGLGLGATVVGGLLALVCGMMGCLWGTVAGKLASSEKADSQKGNAEPSAAVDRGKR